jgi:menaquinone-dependent protoporphyrinogen IX oxidase
LENYDSHAAFDKLEEAIVQYLDLYDDEWKSDMKTGLHSALELLQNRPVASFSVNPNRQTPSR